METEERRDSARFTSRRLQGSNRVLVALAANSGYYNKIYGSIAVAIIFLVKRRGHGGQAVGRMAGLHWFSP